LEGTFEFLYKKILLNKSVTICPVSCQTVGGHWQDVLL